MQADGLQTKSVQIATAVFHPKAGPAGIGVIAANAPATDISSIHEQALGSPEYLHFLAVLRALQLGKQIRAGNISILCPDERIVKLINRETPLEPGSPLAPLYMRIRALMHTYRLAEVRAVPRSRVEAARKLAAAASRMPARKTEPQGKLFAAAG